jgi:branched-chain amino acid transport system permease protein
MWRLVHSPLGRILTAIKQNETRAAFVGYNVWLYKWLAFTLSAGVAGIAGPCSRSRSNRRIRT